MRLTKDAGYIRLSARDWMPRSVIGMPMVLTRTRVVGRQLEVRARKLRYIQSNMRE